MRALVTGGGGFLGRYIVEQLLERGDQVRILARGDYPEFKGMGVEVLRGDLRDPEAVRAAVTGCESVFHVAAVPGIWGAWKTFYDINTLGTLHVLKACHQAGVSRLIYTSSPSVVYDGEAHLHADESLPYSERFLCYYPQTKAIAERAVLAHDTAGGLRTVALRPHLIWGPRDNHLIPRLIARARNGRLRRIGDGSNLISTSYVENAAQAHLLADAELRGATRCAGRAYFINEPEPVRLWEWVDQVLGLAGLPPVNKSISVRTARGIGRVFEGVYTVLPLRGEPPMTRFLASQLSQSHTYSIESARRDFGYEPLVPMPEALARLERDLRQPGGTSS